jgi:hypothetical protein
MPQSREMLESEAIRLLSKLIKHYQNIGNAFMYHLYNYRLGKLLLRRGNRTKNKITKSHAMSLLSIHRNKLLKIHKENHHA